MVDAPSQEVAFGLERARDRGLGRFLHLPKVVLVTRISWKIQPFWNSRSTSSAGHMAHAERLAPAVVAPRNDSVAFPERRHFLCLRTLSFSACAITGALRWSRPGLLHQTL